MCYTTQETLDAKHKKSPVVTWVVRYPWWQLFPPSHVQLGQRLAGCSPSPLPLLKDTTLLSPSCSCSSEQSHDWALANEMWAEVLYATSRTGPWNRPTRVSSTLSALFWRLNAEAPLEDSKVWQSHWIEVEHLEQTVTWARNKLLLRHPWYLQIITVVNLCWPISREQCWHRWHNLGWNIMMVNCADWRNYLLSAFQNLLSSVNV